MYQWICLSLIDTSALSCFWGKCSPKRALPWHLSLYSVLSSAVKSAALAWDFLNTCLHHQLVQSALNAWPTGLRACMSSVIPTAGVTSHHSSDQTQHCLTAWLLDSWWFVSVVHHTIFSQPARTWHHQLLEGRLSLVLGIHCQPANTFSEWLKRGAVKSSNISEAVNLDYTFWFSRWLCCFYATWTLAEWHTTGVQHFFGKRHLTTQCCQLHKQ